MSGTCGTCLRGGTGVTIKAADLCPKMRISDGDRVVRVHTVEPFMDDKHVQVSVAVPGMHHASTKVYRKDENVRIYEP